jgi:cell division protein ZapA
MGQVTLSLNGRTYMLRCGDGEEARLRDLADYVGRRLDDLAMEFGQFGDERLLLMVTLLVTDEMLDLKARLEEMEAETVARPDMEGLALTAGSRAAGEGQSGATQQDGAAAADADEDGQSGPVETSVADRREELLVRPARRSRTSLEARLAEARAPRGKASPESDVA